MHQAKSMEIKAMISDVSQNRCIVFHKVNIHEQNIKLDEMWLCSKGVHSHNKYEISFLDSSIVTPHFLLVDYVQWTQWITSHIYHSADNTMQGEKHITLYSLHENMLFQFLIPNINARILKVVALSVCLFDSLQNLTFNALILWANCLWAKCLMQ